MLGDLKNLLRRRNAFDLTHERKFSMNFFDLVPFFVEDVVPGDTFKVNTEVLLRLAPQLAPVMHRVNVYTHFFFVPNRLSWAVSSKNSDILDTDGALKPLDHEGWESYITQSYHGRYQTLPTEPWIEFNNANENAHYRRVPYEGSIYDYLYSFANPTSALAAYSQRVSALPLRSYIMIWNEWYRDENLQNEVLASRHYAFAKERYDVAQFKEGRDDLTYFFGGYNSTSCLKRCWEKDYFTSARPNAQFGPAVLLPMAGEAPVLFTPVDQGSAKVPVWRWAEEPGALVNPLSTHVFPVATIGGRNVISDGPQFPIYNTTSEPSGSYLTINNDNNNFQVRSKYVSTLTYYQLSDRQNSSSSHNVSAAYDPQGTLYADLSQATAATINELRLGFQLQKFMERSMRAGSRYIESILAHFGVKSPDARLQRPEFLGGGKSPVIFSEVLQTAQTSGSSPQGNMAGHGFSALRSHGFHKTFTEHGWIIGLISVMPRTAYQNGVAKRFDRRGYAEYYWPEFSHIGEQPIRNSELFAYTVGGDDAFGYQSRYDEYRRRESSVHGNFRTSLAYWHMGRNFSVRPSLNAAFVQGDYETPNRVFTVQNGPDKLWVQLVNHCTAIRPIPRRGEPGLIDHF